MYKWYISGILNFTMAERVGFDPTRRLPAYLISSQAPSTELGHLSMLLGLTYCIGLALALSRVGVGI